MKFCKSNLVLLIFSFVAALLAVEGILWLVGFSKPNFYQADQDLGFSFRPGTEGWWRKEGNAYTKINSGGLRDYEYNKNKPGNVYRIAVLGDSYTEALQVPMNKAFWSIIERELPQCEKINGRKVEVINFGISGYGTAQELLMYRKKVKKYDPDIVILAFLTGNDIRNNSRILEGDSMRPYFIRKDGSLVLDNSFHDDPGFRFRTGWFAEVIYNSINHIRILQLMNELRVVLKARRQQQRAIDKQKDVIPGKEIGLDNLVYLEPKTDEWREAWYVTELLIQQMNSEVTESGSLFLLVSLSNGIQVHPDKKKRKEFMIQLGIDNLFYPDFRIREVAEKSEIPYLLLAPELQVWAEKSIQCVHGFPNAYPCGGHWNAIGHSLAGKSIARKICDSVL